MSLSNTNIFSHPLPFAWEHENISAQSLEAILNSEITNQKLKKMQN